MAPTPTVVADGPTQPADATTSVTPARPRAPHPTPVVDDLPSVVAFEDRFRDELADHLDAVREARGKVHDPADTFDVVRFLADLDERLDGYRAALGRMRTLLTSELEEELAAARGRDRGGVPRENMDVPDEGTTIKVRRKWKTYRDIGRADTVRGLALLMAHRAQLAGDPVSDDAVAFGQELVEAVVTSLLGKNAGAVLVGSHTALLALIGEHDDLDAVYQSVKDADRGKAMEYTGVEFERTSPTQPGRPRPAARTSA